MGRPLNKKFFGNRNIGTTGTADDGIGGSRVGSVTVGGVNNSTGYDSGDPVMFSAPQLPGGVTATGAVITAGPPGYAIASIHIINPGSGYTSVPTVTAGTGTIGTTTLTAVFQVDSGAVGSATNQENAIQILAWVPGGSSSVTGDIVAQKGSRRMKVKTAQGTGVVTLVAAVVAAGQATIIATDANGSTYWVTKLTGRKALLTRKVMSGSYEFATDATAQWSFAAAATGIVQIANA